MVDIKEKYVLDAGWYALYTRSRHEKVVASQLADMGIKCYLPVKEVISRWSDRKKLIEKPLFPSYLFVFGDKKERYSAVQADGAVMFISFKGRPARIQEQEIETIKRLLRDDKSTESCAVFKRGDFVEIARGPLAGLTGCLKEVNGKYRLIVNIDSINQGLSVNVSVYDVRPLRSRA